MPIKSALPVRPHCCGQQYGLSGNVGVMLPVRMVPARWAPLQRAGRDFIGRHDRDTVYFFDKAGQVEGIPDLRR